MPSPRAQYAASLLRRLTVAVGTWAGPDAIPQTTAGWSDIMGVSPIESERIIVGASTAVTHEADDGYLRDVGAMVDDLVEAIRYVGQDAHAGVIPGPMTDRAALGEVHVQTMAMLVGLAGSDPADLGWLCIGWCRLLNVPAAKAENIARFARLDHEYRAADASPDGLMDGLVAFVRYAGWAVTAAPVRKPAR